MLGWDLDGKPETDTLIRLGLKKTAKELSKIQMPG